MLTITITQICCWLKIIALPTAAELQACWELCRLNNNIGFWTVWLPTAWSISIAYNAQPDISGLKALSCGALYIPLCLGIKSLIMTIDDLLDHDIDKLVERTRNRPLPREAITPIRGWLFLMLQSIIGISLAQVFLDAKSLQLVKIMCPLYAIYPTCKRWMSFAPIPLGIMFNVGILMGWNSVSTGEDIPWGKLAPVYCGAILWTTTYETIYQHQDKIDDARIGIYSPALLLGKHTLQCCFCAAAMFIGLLIYGGLNNNQGLIFYTGVLIAGTTLLHKILKTDIDCPRDCKAMFLQTPMIGQIILVAYIFDAVTYRIITNIPL